MSSPQKINLEHSSLYQLTATRLKLTLREPEAIFWIFVFPILLAVGLGIAFRNRPADVLPVGATAPQLVQALEAQGLHLSEFRTHSATLEDVFVRLTGRNLRDE